MADRAMYAEIERKPKAQRQILARLISDLTNEFQCEVDQPVPMAFSKIGSDWLWIPATLHFAKEVAVAFGRLHGDVDYAFDFPVVMAA